MAPIVKTKPRAAVKRPQILVVDDEPTLIDLVDDVVGGTIYCNVLKAGSIAEANKIMSAQSVELLVADVNLPDGKGTELLASLRDKHPQASAIVITGAPSVDGAITAIRQGATDFLPKPFTAENLLARVSQALEKQAAGAKKERRLDRLRDAVKRLNEARRLVSKKVDLLCNDLITAYGELSKQLDSVRTQESFRSLLGEAKDLEQMLCHAMDWTLRQLGYSNVAIWLTGEDGEFQLGAFMKYTTPGEPSLTEPMRENLLKQVHREGFLHLSPEEAREVLTPAELKHLAGQTVMGVTCTYLGEALAAVVLFRDGKTPFSQDDAATLKAISPIFATSLASIVRTEEEGNGEEFDEDRRGPNDRSSADWWKRGEEPPF